MLSLRRLPPIEASPLACQAPAVRAAAVPPYPAGVCSGGMAQSQESVGWQPQGDPSPHAASSAPPGGPGAGRAHPFVGRRLGRGAGSRVP
eukprot:14658188-Alexandrium_andersonii.AAC.1